MSLRLYSYYRSSAAYRVRIALNYKKLDYELVPVSLLKDINDVERLNYKKINPQGLLPFLQHNDVGIGQSMAIIEYLEEAFPENALLPKALAARAFVRQMANLITCDIHPLNNLRVLKYLSAELSASEELKNNWYRHWIMEGFAALESLLLNSQMSGRYCHQDEVSIADICLVPQLYNARRYNCPLDDFPLIQKIENECLKLDVFVQAAPENQPDAITA